MNGIGARLRRAAQDHSSSVSATSVLAVGATLIVVQIGFRGWAVLSAWFYGDDYNLLADEIGRSASWTRFVEPYNDHVMPGGKFVAWVVTGAGPLNWELAAGFAIAGQLLASVAALWMLVTLFGPRSGILVPLTLYLFSAVTMPAYLWWAAALNQLIPQAALFAAVACWVHYLRGRSWRWLVATTASVGLGLVFFEKAALIFPVLAFLALAYFASGGPRQRLRTVLTRYWPAAVPAALLGGLYTAYYVTSVDGALESPPAALVGGLANTMLGSAFPTGLVGGPWRWADQPQPAAYADPPAFTVHLAWVLIAAVVAYLALRRTRTLRSWVLLIGYVVVLYLLLLGGRAPLFGAGIGMEYRYLTDAIAMMVLCLGLASMTLIGATEPSQLRDEPVLRFELPRVAVVGLTAAVAVSGAVGSFSYARTWHATNASDPYLQVLRKDLNNGGAVDLADVAAPDEVLSFLTAPNNTVSQLTGLSSAEVSYPEASSRLLVPDATGSLRTARIELGVRGRPGPTPDCGWLVGSAGRTVPLEERAFEWTWWVRIGYLASDNSPVRVTAGDSTVDTEVLAGLNSLFVRVDGSFSAIRFDGLDSGVTMCADDIEVGQIVPGGAPS